MTHAEWFGMWIGCMAVMFAAGRYAAPSVRMVLRWPTGPWADAINEAYDDGYRDALDGAEPYGTEPEPEPEREEWLPEPVTRLDLPPVQPVPRASDEAFWDEEIPNEELFAPRMFVPVEEPPAPVPVESDWLRLHRIEAHLWSERIDHDLALAGMAVEAIHSEIEDWMAPRTGAFA